VSQIANDRRRAALDAYLSECESRGFLLESRTDTQAIVVRRSRLARYRRRRGGTRIVVWVDEHGTVETRTIEARRW
jgi:hypothetical protein